MGYLRAPGTRMSPGVGGRFGFGMMNPNVAPGSVRRPTGRVGAGGGGAGGIATAYSQSALDAPTGYRPQRSRTPIHTGRGRGTKSLNKGGSGFVWDREHPGFNEPDIPEMRELGEVERYTGERWAPSEGYESSVVDTAALIDATDALIAEQLGGTMSEAARRFGQSGALQSGGGLGGGYAGTLAESERGAMRDRSEMRHRYRFQAEQADAARQAAAYNQAMQRELAAHEGYEGRRFADVNMANQWGLGAWDRGSDYDRWRYGAEVGAAGREQEDAIAELMALYGG